MRHKTKVDTIRQKLTQSDRSQSYPDIESCEEVGSLVDDVGELVAAQLLVVVDVALLEHLVQRCKYKWNVSNGQTGSSLQEGTIF